MADITWVKIASWHILRFDDPKATVCGLEVGEEDEVSDELGTGKSCENCLRIIGRKIDEEPVSE
jgi:hypothetical protein